MQKPKSNPKQLARYCILLISAYLILNLTGCATSPLIRPAKPKGIPGIYHRVNKGQTLWRLSKIYNVDLDKLVSINRISDVRSIEIGQLIFIPNRLVKQKYTTSSTSEEFIWPLKGGVISSFGENFNNMVNKGVNIKPYSNLNIVAARSGKVIFYAENFGSFGKTIIIDHGDGLSTIYARNSVVYVKLRDNIQKGTVIAKAGSAGRDKNRYLHFQIRKGHIPQNPLFYLPR